MQHVEWLSTFRHGEVCKIYYCTHYLTLQKNLPLVEIFAKQRAYLRAYSPRATNDIRFPPMMLDVLYLTLVLKIQRNVLSLQE